MGWRGVGEWHKGSSICDTPAKELENLRPVVSKNTILLLRQRQDSQIAIYIDPKQHWTSKVISQIKEWVMWYYKIHILTNFVLKECAYSN